MRAITVTGRRGSGFTFVELLVVLMVLSLLAAIVVPNVSGGVRRAEEAALRENLFVLRKALDDYYADKGEYPPSLGILVEKRYIRSLPTDPVADEGADWNVTLAEEGRGVIDVHSRSERQGRDGVPYAQW